MWRKGCVEKKKINKNKKEKNFKIFKEFLVCKSDMLVIFFN